MVQLAEMEEGLRTLSDYEYRNGDGTFDGGWEKT